MRDTSYWTRLREARLGRRRVLTSAAIGGAGLAGLALVGCGGGNEGSATATASGSVAATPKRGGTLQVLVNGAPPNFDVVLNSAAAIRSAINPVYGRLWKPKTGNGRTPWDFQIEPDLAASLEQPDKTTYVFKVRPGVKWQDKPPLNGREFVADDVVYSLRRAINDPASTVKGELEAVESVRATDPRTVEIKTKEPFAPLNSKLGGTLIWMFPHEVVEQSGDLKQKVIGTGPYVLDRYTPDVSLEYSRNPTYYGAPMPYMDKVTLSLIPDASAQEAAFTTGKIDILPLGDRRAFDRMSRAVPGIQSQSYDGVGHYFYFRSDRPPFQDVRVRQAFALTIDYDGLIQAFTSGEGHVETLVPQAMKAWSLPKDQWGEGAKYHSKPDIAEAKKLLEAAGMAGGVETNLYYSSSYRGTNQLESVLQAIAAGAEKAGFRLKLTPEEYAVYIQRHIGNSEYSGMSHSPMSIFNDPDEYVFTYLHPKGRRNGTYRSDNPELTSLIDKQRHELDNQARKQILGDIEKRNLVNNYFMPLYALKTYTIWQKRLRNYGTPVDPGRAWAEDAWIEE